MRKTILLSALVLPGLLSAQEPSFEIVPETDLPAVAAHVARAKEIAGEEFGFLADSFVCQPAANAIPLAMRNVPGFLDPNAPGVEPFRAFDNLYYVGPHAIGSWILDTGEGLVMFDSLNNEGEALNILLPGMSKLGLNPKDIKRIFITHGHFDHYGGSVFLSKEFGARIAMSGPDWDYLPNDISVPYARVAGYPPVEQPERDLVVEDGDVLDMGRARVRFIVTPGHTPGTLSTIVTVDDRGKPRKIGMWGGQALPRDPVELAQMHNSLHRFWRIGKSEGVEGVISTHPWVVGNFEMRKRARDDGANPLLIGTDGFDRIMGIYDECIHAEFARRQSVTPRPRFD